MTSEKSSLTDLFERNRDFAQTNPDHDYDIHDPTIVTVSCCDARVPQGRLFGSGPGGNFTVAKIGNVVSERDDQGEPIVAGSVVYPIAKTSPSYAIVVGHTDCGAVTAAYSQAAEGAEAEARELQNELDVLLPVVEEGLDLVDTDSLSRDEQITRLVEYNVDHQVETLLPHADDVPVVGVVCDLHGYYPGDPGQCHLVNYDGERRKDDLPDELHPYFSRRLHW